MVEDEEEEIDLDKSLNNQKQMLKAETALENDLRNAGIFAEILWHDTTEQHYIFRFEFNTDLFDAKDFKKALRGSKTESYELGISEPYFLEKTLCVCVNKAYLDD